MYITQETDYAVRIVYCLAKENKRCDALFISTDVGVTLRFTLKILGKLVRGNIVKSYRGTKGGYEIAKEPKEISINDVLEALEGKYKLSRCVGNDDGCCELASNGYCKFKQIFVDISEDVNKKLSAATFDKFL